MNSRLGLRSVAILTGCVYVALGSSAMAKHGDGHGSIKCESKVDVAGLTKRAYDGNANAQYALASLYEQGGSGVKKDLAYAVSWYEEAAHNGLRVAAEKLKNLSNTP